MDETLALIQHLADERHMLFRLAGRQHLDAAHQTRLGELKFQLPMLWDRYRRELAASRSYTRKIIPFEQRRAA
jgi:hypothetical protein